MITLYGSPATRAHRVIWMLQELKLEYSLEPLDREDPTHRALNPNAKVPILADGDFVLWESIAINLYLASRYGGGLQPDSDQGRWHATQWSLWGVAEVEENAARIARHHLDLPGGDLAEATAAEGALSVVFDVLEHVLADRSHLLGQEFSVADLNVASVVFPAKVGAFDLSRTPRVASWLEDALGRPACPIGQLVRERS